MMGCWKSGIHLPGKCAMGEKKQDKKERFKKILRLLKSLNGEKPDIGKLDFSKYHQTEEEYQKEQENWLNKVKRKKGK
jgi:hypothetical protein